MAGVGEPVGVADDDGLTLACADQEKNVYSRLRRTICSVVSRSCMMAMDVLGM
jgi:hypothetical protein